MPDLRACGAVVRPGVGGVIELACQEAVGRLGGDLLGLFHGAHHAALGGGQHQLRAVGCQHLAALHAHGLRHGEDDIVASGNAHGGEADAGVAGGRLHDGAAGQELAVLFGGFDHLQRHAILHGSGGVKVFQLHKHRCRELKLLAVAHGLQQGGVTDQLGCRAIDVHNDLPFIVGQKMPTHPYVKKAEGASCTLCRLVKNVLPENQASGDPAEHT